MNVMANVSRGAGNMVVPAFAIAIGEAFHLALSPALITGWARSLSSASRAPRWPRSRPMRSARSC
jgi:hypothetical protein